MKQPPMNTNVPKHIWESACRDYKIYKDKYDILLGIGLSDEQADQYLEALNELDQVIMLLDPLEDDFRHDDHSCELARANAALTAINELLK